jgi:hypothetical protein
MISALCMTTHAAVTPGGTFSDKAIFVETGGGETLAAAPGAGTLGAALVNDFDNTIASDASYELNPSGQIALMILEETIAPNYKPISRLLDPSWQLAVPKATFAAPAEPTRQ